MTAALAYVEELRDHHTPMRKAANLHELRVAHETANVIINAQVQAAAKENKTVTQIHPQAKKLLDEVVTYYPKTKSARDAYAKGGRKIPKARKSEKRQRPGRKKQA